MAIPIAIINPVASATDEQTTEQLAVTPEPVAPKVADGNCGDSGSASFARHLSITLLCYEEQDLIQAKGRAPRRL